MTWEEFGNLELKGQRLDFRQLNLQDEVPERTQLHGERTPEIYIGIPSSFDEVPICKYI